MHDRLIDKKAAEMLIYMQLYVPMCRLVHKLCVTEILVSGLDGFR